MRCAKGGKSMIQHGAQRGAAPHLTSRTGRQELTEVPPRQRPRRGYLLCRAPGEMTQVHLLGIGQPEAIGCHMHLAEADLLTNFPWRRLDFLSQPSRRFD